MISELLLTSLSTAIISGQYPTIAGEPIFCYMEDSSGRVIPLDICGGTQIEEPAQAGVSSTVADALNFSAADKRKYEAYYDRKLCEFKIGNPLNEPIRNYDELAAASTTLYIQGYYAKQFSGEDFSALSAGIREYIASELAIPEPDCD